MLEWYDGEAMISLFAENMFIKGNITKFEFKSAYAQTEYGIDRYETTPFLMNIAFFGGMSVVNKMIRLNKTEIPSKWGYFEMKDLTLDYFDNYMAMGITPMFKKFNASDWSNSTYYNNKTTPVKNLTTQSVDTHHQARPYSFVNVIKEFGQKLMRMVMWSSETRSAEFIKDDDDE